MTISPARRRGVEIPALPRTRGFAAAQEVLRSPRFTSTMHNAHTFEIFGGAVLTLDGPEHRSRRQAERALFAPAARRRYERVVVDELRARLDQLHAGSETAVELELLALARPIFLQATARIVGVDGVDTVQRAEELGGIVSGLRGVSGSDFISGDKGEALRRAQAVKADFVQGFFAESVGVREAARSNEEPIAEGEEDLIALLLEAYPEWSEDEYVRECLFFLAAAGGTQLNAIGHAVVELDRWVGESDERRAMLNDREFLQRAVVETMRHHPPLPMLVRRATRDVTLADGTVVPEGEDVAVDLFSANFDPEVWGQDAHQFDPFRSVATGTLPHGVTFALGPHTCPGRPVAIGDERNDGVEPPWGIIPQILLELYSRGARVDSARPPRPSHEYTFPVWGEVWLRLDPSASIGAGFR